jgi:serine-protein kinase ATM
LKKPTEIQQEYFHKATELLQEYSETLDPKSLHAHAEVYHQYAKFAEEQYQNASRSPDMIRWKIYVDRKSEEIKVGEDNMKNHLPDTSEYNTIRKEVGHLKKLLAEDKKLHKAHRQALEAFLKGAIEMYSKCLQASDRFNQDAVLRLCSLWLSNFLDDAIQQDIAIALDRVASHKFTFLAVCSSNAMHHLLV